MTTTFEFKAMHATQEDIQKVKEFKTKYIDYVTMNGIFYNSISFVSNVLNFMIDYFNNPENVTLDLWATEAREWDMKMLREHSDTFLRVLKNKGISNEVFEHVKETLNRSFDMLLEATMDARERRKLVEV